MAHSSDYAKRLFRELLPTLPTEAETVLNRASYWDPRVLEMFLDYTEELIHRDPDTGLQVALIAPRYARTMPEEPGSEGRRSERERLVKALSLIGTAYRILARFDDEADELQSCVSAYEY